MKQRYQIEGSYTLYQVWGIFVLIFGGITALGGLIMTIINISESSEAAKYAALVSSNANTYAVLYSILFFIVTAIVVGVKILTGILFVKRESRSKGAYLFYAVLYFLSSFGWMILMVIMLITGNIVGDAVGYFPKEISSVFDMAIVIWVIFFIIKIAWDIMTGIFLIRKRSRLVPVQNNGGASGDSSTFYDPPAPWPQQNPFDDISSWNNQSANPFDRGGAPVVGRIQGVFGDYQGKTYELHSGQVCTIGRESNCDIQIRHAKVSRLHCTISKTADGMYQITDRSTNGTFYDNKRLQKNMPVKVFSGGMLVVGEADNVLQLK